MLFIGLVLFYPFRPAENLHLKSSLIKFIECGVFRSDAVSDKVRWVGVVEEIRPAVLRLTVFKNGNWVLLLFRQLIFSAL